MGREANPVMLWAKAENSCWESRLTLILSLAVFLVATAFVVPAAAAGPAGLLGENPDSGEGKTVWLCKPGIADNPCLDNDLGGTRYSPSGITEIDFRPATNPGFDCFYVYPTQSVQAGPNADLSRDKELKDVAINQAAQFSRICDVYAPVYPQYTLAALSGQVTDEVRDIAYEGVLKGWREYLERHNRGRGVVLLGHSQGASHLSRLIDEEIDPRPTLRRRMISAIVPGSNNIYVPKGGVVGGNLTNIPACTRGDQLGCVMAWSLYLDKAESGLPANATFGKLTNGYWVYPEERPNPETYEVLCVNPAELSGSEGLLEPMVNLPVFLNQGNVADPWTEIRETYRAGCQSGPDSSWLDMKTVQGGVTNLAFVLSQINTNLGGLHTGDINLALGNLITIASRQGKRYMAWQGALKRSAAADRALEGARKRLAKVSAKARKAAAACRSTGSRALCRKARAAERQEAKARKKVEKLQAAARRAAEAAEQAYGSV